MVMHFRGCKSCKLLFIFRNIFELSHQPRLAPRVLVPLRSMMCGRHSGNKLTGVHTGKQGLVEQVYCQS